MSQIPQLPSVPRTASVLEPNCGSCRYFHMITGFCVIAWPIIVTTDLNKTCDGHTGNFLYAIVEQKSIVENIHKALNEYYTKIGRCHGWFALTIKVSPFYIDEIKDEINKMSSAINPHVQDITIFGNYLLFDGNVPEDKIIIAHKLITIK